MAADDSSPFFEMSSKASVVASSRHHTSSSSSGEPRASKTSARVTNVPILLIYTHTHTLKPLHKYIQVLHYAHEYSLKLSFVAVSQTKLFSFKIYAAIYT